MRERVFEFVTGLGYQLAADATLEPGTPDGVAASWVSQRELDLLVLPFHVHRDRNGDYVDGTGVAALLDPRWVGRGAPILMPVSGFSWSARFPRRFGELNVRRPDVARLVVPMPESRIGDDEVVRAIQSIAVPDRAED